MSVKAVIGLTRLERTKKEREQERRRSKEEMVKETRYRKVEDERERMEL